MMKNRKYEKYVYALVGVIGIIVVGRFVFQWKEQNDYRQQTINKLMDKVDGENKIAVLEKELSADAPEQQENSLKEEMKIRVLLTNPKNESYYHDNVVLKSTGSMEEDNYNLTFSENQLISVDQIDMTDKPMIFSSEQGIEILSVEKNGRHPAYEGVLEIYKGENGYSIINAIDLEQYLKYVVPSEMPSSYPEEALKAQAVCARTYALKQIMESRIKEFPAHVDDTVSYQVYNQIDRQESTDRAVEATRGQIICYQQEPIQAYFFSTSCGYTSTEQVWSGGEFSEPYLKTISVSKRTVEAIANGTDLKSSFLNSEEVFTSYIRNVQSMDYEKEESWYRWNVKLPWEKLNNRIADNNWEIGFLTDIKVEKRTNGGAVCKLQLIGTDGETAIENEYAIREFFSPENHIITRNDGSQIQGSSLLPSAYMDLEIVEEDNRQYLKIYGGGYGHGVGMSQNGAKEMAKDGLSWENIIEIFFQDTEISLISDIAY